MTRQLDRNEFEHPALVYSSVDEFLSYLVPYVVEGVERDENVFIAVGDEQLFALRDAVGARAASIGWASTDKWHPNPSRRLRAFYEMIGEGLESGRRSRLVGEPIWPAGFADLTVEWQRYESVLNRVLAPFPAILVCTYDRASLSPAVIASAFKTHPTVQQNGYHDSSPEFESPEELLRCWTVTLSPPPEGAVQLPAFKTLSQARHFLSDRALEAGVHSDRTMELLVAANEVLTNALTHGLGVAALRAWADGDFFYCEVEDAGRGISDPLAGYTVPALDSNMGRGLWMARQNVDLLQIDASDAGTKIRLCIKSNGSAFLA